MRPRYAEWFTILCGLTTAVAVVLWLMSMGVSR
jgi:hypothetical protein